MMAQHATKTHKRQRVIRDTEYNDSDDGAQHDELGPFELDDLDVSQIQ
eukprot:gene207-207_t